MIILDCNCKRCTGRDVDKYLKKSEEDRMKNTIEDAYDSVVDGMNSLNRLVDLIDEDDKNIEKIIEYTDKIEYNLSNIQDDLLGLDS